MIGRVGLGGRTGVWYRRQGFNNGILVGLDVKRLGARQLADCSSAGCDNVAKAGDDDLRADGLRESSS